MKRRIRIAGLAAGCLALSCMMSALAADVRSGDKLLVAKTYRASKLHGLNVRNSQGEKIGTIDDFVINIEKGNVAYVALGFGGLLGVGEKLFAVPYDQVKFAIAKDGEMFFVMDMDKEKLRAAPGFHKNDWPDFADPNWSREVDAYYHQAKAKETQRSIKTSDRDAKPSNTNPDLNKPSSKP